MIQRVKEVSGFTHSKIPFKYLGVPLCSKRVTVAEYDSLAEKMCARIKVWSSRHLSYVGRIQLINLVLLSIHINKAQDFMIPKSVLKAIERVCRAYLWYGSYYSNKPGNIKWDEVCSPKSADGLGFRRIKE